MVLSLLDLLVAELNSTKGLGPVMAIGIAVGLLAMITLLPRCWSSSAAGCSGRGGPSSGRPSRPSGGLWARIGQRVARRPRLVWVVTAVVLGALALGVTGLKANGLQQQDSFRTKPESVTGEAVLARHFPAGAGNPVQVIGNASAAAARLHGGRVRHTGVTQVTRPLVKDGLAYVEGTLTVAPDSQAAYDTVDRLRDRVHAIAGADAKVGGGSAVNLDIQRASRHDRNLVVPLVLLVVLVILGAAAAGGRRAAAAGRHRGAVVRRRAGGQRPGLRPRVRLRRCRPVVPAVDLRVPGRAGHRLQHLPDDQGP